MTGIYFRKEFGKHKNTIETSAISFCLFGEQDEFIWFGIETRKRHYSFGLKNPFSFNQGVKC